MRRAVTMAALVLLAPAAVAASLEPPAAARFGYTGYMGGIKVGYATIDVSLGQERYAAKLSMETGGLAGMFVDWQHGSSAYGAATPNGAAPFTADAYLNSSIWRGENRYVEVGFADGVAEIDKAAPHPVEDEGRPAVDANMRRGVLDPLSAILALGRALEETGVCTADFGVFDGRRRYQFVVTDSGDRELERNSYAPFGGVARRCDFEFKRVAGFKNDKKGPPTKGRAYFRSTADGAPLMPIQVFADSKYGATILHLRTVELIDPALAELAARKLDVTNPD